MRGYLLDTHVWFWFMTGSERLPGHFREAIEAEPKRCWLSGVSVWELGMLADKDRIRLEPSTRQWVSNALEHLPLNEAPLTHAVALRSLELDLPHRDPADHFLAATAIVFELVLLTVDQRLLDSSSVSTNIVAIQDPPLSG